MFGLFVREAHPPRGTAIRAVSARLGAPTHGEHAARHHDARAATLTIAVQLSAARRWLATAALPVQAVSRGTSIVAAAAVALVGGTEAAGMFTAGVDIGLFAK